MKRDVNQFAPGRLAALSRGGGETRVASSSCSYAAIALARQLLSPRSAGFTAADRLRDRLDEPGVRARDRDRNRPRLAVHARRVRRGRDDRLVALLPGAAHEAASSARRASRCQAEIAPLDGRSCRHGHVDLPSRHRLAAPALARGLHVDRACVRDGVGCRLARHRDRPGRRRHSRLGCPSRGGGRSSSPIGTLRGSGAGDRAGRCDYRLHLLEVNVPLAGVLWNGGTSASAASSR